MTSEHPRPSARKKNSGISGRIFFLLGAVLAVFLLVATLFGRIRLTALNDEAVSVAASIQQQRLERAKLLIDHEMIYDLTRVESYAREERDMQRPRGEQLQYLDTELPDRVTLYPERKGIFTDGGKSLLDSIGSCFQ